MPAEHPGLATPPAHRVFELRRRSERRSTSLAAVIVTSDGEVHARLTDVSAGGLGLRVDHLAMLRPGQHLRVTCPQFGEVTCIIRWAIPPRYGAEVTSRGHELARLRHFYDTLPSAVEDMS